eukprot:m.431311 g.431311  ORF g.431311 m.431311 type:complete len:907 (-) comp21401_c0_seq1:98-2818(-)
MASSEGDKAVNVCLSIVDSRCNLSFTDAPFQNTRLCGTSHEEGLVVAVALLSSIFGCILLVGIFFALRHKIQHLVCCKCIRKRRKLQVSGNTFEGALDQITRKGMTGTSLQHKSSQNAMKMPREIERRKISVLDILGAGNFGEVCRGTLSESEEIPAYPVAIKVLNKSNAAAYKEVLREAMVMSAVGIHENLVGVIGICTKSQGAMGGRFADLLGNQGKIMIVLQYCEYGSLEVFLKQMYEEHNELVVDSKLKVCHDIAKGMEYLNSKGFIHRDLAMRNVLVSSNQVCKVSDFGMTVCMELHATSYNEEPGTTPLPTRWTAPEALKEGIFSQVSDVWSFGVTVFEIYNVPNPPYDGMKGSEILNFLEEGNRMPKPPNMQADIYSDLVLKCWTQDYKDRILFKEILRYLKHRISIDLPGGQRLHVQDIDVAAEAMEQPTTLTTSSSATGPDGPPLHALPSYDGTAALGLVDAEDPSCGELAPAPDVHVIKARGALQNILSDEAHPVVVFTNASCATGWTVESVLRLSHVPVRTVTLSDSPMKDAPVHRALSELYPSVGLPQIHLAGTLLGSVGDLCRAYASGELQKVLQLMDVVDGCFELELSAIAQSLRCVCSACDIMVPNSPGSPLARQRSADGQFGSGSTYGANRYQSSRTRSSYGLYSGSVPGGYATGYSGMSSFLGDVPKKRSRSKFLRNNSQQKSGDYETLIGKHHQQIHSYTPIDPVTVPLYEEGHADTTVDPIGPVPVPRSLPVSSSSADREGALDSSTSELHAVQGTQSVESGGTKNSSYTSFAAPEAEEESNLIRCETHAALKSEATLSSEVTVVEIGQTEIAEESLQDSPPDTASPSSMRATPTELSTSTINTQSRHGGIETDFNLSTNSGSDVTHLFPEKLANTPGEWHSTEVSM